MTGEKSKLWLNLKLEGDGEEGREKEREKRQARGMAETGEEVSRWRMAFKF